MEGIGGQTRGMPTMMMMKSESRNSTDKGEYGLIYSKRKYMEQESWNHKWRLARKFLKGGMGTRGTWSSGVKGLENITGERGEGESKALLYT